jgi:hypothetical protein
LILEKLLMNISCGILAALGVLLPICASASPDGGLTGQQAIYDLSLAKVRTHDVTGAAGQMRFSVADGCTGWGTTQHMTLLIRNTDGSLNKSVTDYVTWESKDGHEFTFELRERDDDGKTVTDTAGTAIRAPDGSGTITYATPANRVMTMPKGTLFPMAHTALLLQSGREGKKFISVPLFDGTADDGPQDTFVVLLDHHPPEKSRFPQLAKLASTDVDIAFYPRKHVDEKPDFRSQIRYYDDGVAENITMDFGSFIMRGRLRQLTIPPSGCK